MNIEQIEEDDQKVTRLVLEAECDLRYFNIRDGVTDIVVVRRTP